MFLLAIIFLALIGFVIEIVIKNKEKNDKKNGR